MKSIVVSVLEFPVVSIYEGRLVATHGASLSWSEEQMNGRTLVPAVAEAYREVLQRQPVVEGFVGVASGDRCAYVHSTANGPVAVANIPRHWLASRMRYKKRLRSFVKMLDVAELMIREAALEQFLREATTHGIVNANAQITGALDRLRLLLGHKMTEREESALLNIEKGTTLISATLSSAGVLSPRWYPNLDCEYVKIHKTIFAVLKRWQVDLDARRIQVRMGSNYDQVRIEADLLYLVIENVFSNIVKYARSDSFVNVEFDLRDESMDVHFVMTSLFLSEAELAKIFYVGGRSELAVSKEGKGLGMSLMLRIMKAFHGDLFMRVGDKTVADDTFSENCLTLRFPRSRVRLATS